MTARNDAQATESLSNGRRKQRVLAVRRVLAKENLPRDMKAYWSGVLSAVENRRSDSSSSVR